jgi:5-bromo-4-chloroindolyl phosphate hydrolysis protein
MFSLTFAFVTAFRPNTLLTTGFFFFLAATFFVPTFYLMLCMGLIVGAYFVIKPTKKQKPAIIKIAKPEPPKQEATTEPQTQQNTEKQEQLWELTNKLKSKIYIFNDKAIESKVIALHDTTFKIASFIDKYPQKIRRLNKFMEYYLPTTINLLDSYKHLTDQGRKGENIIKATEKIEDLLKVLQKAYDNQLDALFEDKALDIDAEVNVLKNILEKEGLLEVIKGD